MLRWLGAGLVWILAGLVGLVGALLCVTIILLPLGIPALMLAKRLFSLAARMVLPRVVTKPTSMVKEPAGRLGAVLARLGNEPPRAAPRLLDTGKGAVKKGRKQGRKARKALEKKTGRRKRLGFI